MDLNFNDMMEQYRPKLRSDDSERAEETDQDSSTGQSSLLGRTDTQEDHISSRIDFLSAKVQEMVEKINDGRTTDQKVIDSFHEKLVEKVTELCQQMKAHMYMVYEENSKEMQVKLQELYEVLDRCTKLNNELLEASMALAGLIKAGGSN